MKILYLVGQFSYPFRVGAMQYTSIIEYMSQRHDCDMIAFPFSADNKGESIEAIISKNLPKVNALGVYGKNSGLTLGIKKIKQLISLMPLGFAPWDNHECRKAIDEALKNCKYDLIHLIYFPAVAQYVPLFKNVPIILTLGDSFSLACIEHSTEIANPIEKMLYKFASLLYRRAECKMLPLVAKAHVVSQNDMTYLRSISKRNDITHIPLHISREYESMAANSDSKYDEPSIILVRPFGNGFKWFISEVYPLLMKSIRNLRITILSQELAAEMSAEISKLANIQYIRWVDDFAKEVLRHRVVVLTDSFGTGMSTRVISCMALGMPVIGTSTSFRSVSFKKGIECFIEDETNLFADAIISVLLDDRKASLVGQAAKRAVLAQYSYDIIMSRIDDLYAAAATQYGTHKFMR